MFQTSGESYYGSTIVRTWSQRGTEAACKMTGLSGEPIGVETDMEDITGEPSMRFTSNDSL